MERHSSFGLISLSRLSHTEGQALFGAFVPSTTTIRLTIQAATVQDSFGSVRFTRDYENKNKAVIVDLTPSQFSELLTTMGVGEGVPCTFSKFGDLPIEKYESHFFEKPIDRVQSYIKESFESSEQEIVDGIEGLKGLLENKKLNKEEKQKISFLINRLSNRKHNVDFYVGRLNEAAMSLVTAAKAEVDSFISSVSSRMGVTKENSKLSLDLLDKE